MSKPLTPITAAQRQHIEQGIKYLREARDLFARAEAKHAANAVRRALKSAEGALRHAEGRRFRAF